jgi:hypothetical protein
LPIGDTHLALVTEIVTRRAFPSAAGRFHHRGMGRVERGTRRYEIHVFTHTSGYGEEDVYVSAGKRAEALLVPGTRFRVVDREDGVNVWSPPDPDDGAAGGWETKTVVYLEVI